MKFLKKKVLRPFRHVYTEDDYKWIGKRNNYEVVLRRFTEESVIKYYFIISINNRDENTLMFNSKEEGIYLDSLESVEIAAIEYVDKKLY